MLAATNAIFENAVQTSAPGVDRIADLPFGDHMRQRLDAYVPDGRSLATLLFVPGGGFTAGGKDEHPSFYRNVGVYFAKKGFLTFIANYRLAPECCWAEQTHDVASAVRWVGENVKRYGGVEEGLSVIGHSAGAVNLAGFLSHPRYEGQAVASGVRKAILISGVYRFAEQSPKNVQLYAGEREAWPDRSPINHIGRCRVPLVLCAAELDPEELASSTIEFAMANARVNGHYAPMYVLPGHNHVSTVRSIGSPAQAVGELLSSFTLTAESEAHQ